MPKTPSWNTSVLTMPKQRPLWLSLRSACRVGNCKDCDELTELEEKSTTEAAVVR
jgi:hypothetical protein